MTECVRAGAVLQKGEQPSKRVMGRNPSKTGNHHQVHEGMISALGCWLLPPRSEFLNHYGSGPYLTYQFLVNSLKCLH